MPHVNPNFSQPPEFSPPSAAQAYTRPLSNSLEATLQDHVDWVRNRLANVLCLTIAIALILALASYHPTDAAWSTTGKTGLPQNILGTMGAWAADVLLYCFGRSISWVLWVIILWNAKSLWIKHLTDSATLVQEGINNRALGAESGSAYQTHQTHYLNDLTQHLLEHTDSELLMMRWYRVVFLLLWLLVSCGLEALRLNHWGATLPLGAGGLLGLGVGGVSQALMPERFVVVLFAMAWFVLAAASTGFSWLALIDRVGSLWDDFQSKQHIKQDAAENQAMGQALQAQRNTELAELNASFAPTEIQINTTAPAVLPAYVPPPRPALDTQPAAAPANALNNHFVVINDGANDANSVNSVNDVSGVNNMQGVNGMNGATGVSSAKDSAQYLNHAAPLASAKAVVQAAAQSVSMAAVAKVAAIANTATLAMSARLPSLGLLDKPDAVFEFVPRETVEYTSRLIEKKLRDYNVAIKIVAAQPGPVITRYEVDPAEGVKGSQIVGLARDLARSLSLTSIRVVETIPGKTTMGLELPNPKRQIVRLAEILSSSEYATSDAPLTMALGKGITGESVVMDLAKMPHLLVAGTTGSGKSVGINAMILSLLYKSTADQVRLILIDPKMLELSVYEGIPHLLAPVVTDMKQASHAVNWCVAEMERRYKLMSRLGVRGIAGYNEKIAAAQAAGEFIFNPFSLTPEDPEPLKPFTYIVLVVDELADLLMVVGKKIEEPLARLAQKSRACGIHLILATQRPSADVLTGLIRSNVPARIAFQVSSKTDSRIILDQMGADALLGNGDMLYLPKGSIPMRVHGAFVSDEEVVRVATMLRELGAPDYIDGILDGDDGEDDTDGNEMGDNDAEQDALYDKAVEVVLTTKKASISNVQRQLRVGYQRAARMIDAMENAGLISAAEHNGNRTVLAKSRSYDD